MAAVFNNALTSGVGTAEATLYTAAGKAILVGCNLANVTKATLPVTVRVKRGSNYTSIITNKRVENGENFEVMRGNKLVLVAGDSVVATAGDDSAFDIILSLLEGVA